MKSQEMEKIKKSVSSWVSASLIFSCLWLLPAGSLCAQQSLESFFRMSGPGVTKAFEQQREVIQKCSAVFYNGRDEVSYGVVISEDGYIFSKASEIEGIKDLSARVGRESFDKAEIILVDPVWDVALVKVAAKGLTPASFAADSKIAQGSWVVVNGATSRTRRRVLVGVISANAREIPSTGGVVLGLTIKAEDGILTVSEVNQGGGADAAGIKKNDVILTIEEKSFSKIEELVEFLKDKQAGTKVKMQLERDGQVLEVEVVLSTREELSEGVDRNDMMSGDFSKRRSGFPRVIQHDILANSDTMGGPVLNLNGQVVGMNIARANRAETFAIPVEELRELVSKMLDEKEK